MAKKTAKTAVKAKAAPRKTVKPKLLSGGNPQIAKGYGDAPVQAYIAAVPGWRRDVCKQLDTIISKAVPGVKKAVKWNSPFYGKIENAWFLRSRSSTAPRSSHRRLARQSKRASAITTSTKARSTRSNSRHGSNKPPSFLARRCEHHEEGKESAREEGGRGKVRLAR